MFQVVKKVAEKYPQIREVRRGRPTKYPFGELLSIGDGFHVECKPDEYSVTRGRITSAGRVYSGKFNVYPTASGIAVERVA